MARVAVITPNMKGTSPKVGGKNRIQPPLSLACLSATLTEYGHEVFVRDTALEGYDNIEELGNNLVRFGETDDQIQQYLVDVNPDVVFISAVFSNLAEHALEVARIAKTANPNVKVAMGGNHASNTISDYEFALRNPECGIPTTIKELDDPNIDVLVRGEADFIAPVLADRLANDQNIHNLDGVAIKSNGSYRINAAPPRLEAAKLPIPRRDLMNMEGYFNLGMYHSPTKGGERALNVMASRGCPEKCSFCTTPAMWGAKVRWRNVDDIVAEIERSIEEYGIEQIQFEDDTITANKSKAIDLFTKVGRFGKKLFVPNGSKANYHKRHQLEMYKVMADAGMHQINIAAESGSQRVLDQVIHKNLKTDEVLNAIDNAKEAGIPKVHVFYVVGMVGETRAEIEETLEFARTAGSDSYSIAMFAPLPGTPMYHQVMKQDLWWPGVEPSDIIYNRSLIRVDGFSNPKEFEAFIEAHSKSKKLT